MSSVTSLLRASSVVLLLLVCACSSTHTANHPKFHEASKANVIIQFPSWDAICITKPAVKEGHFAPFCRRPEAEQRLARMNTPRHLAVVICNYYMPADQQLDDQKAWSEIFSKLGFERVVFLRAGEEGSGPNGLPVLKDVLLTQPTPAGG
jgi:hypothetical protein